MKKRFPITEKCLVSAYYADLLNPIDLQKFLCFYHYDGINLSIHPSILFYIANVNKEIGIQVNEDLPRGTSLVLDLNKSFEFVNIELDGSTIFTNEAGEKIVSGNTNVFMPSFALNQIAGLPGSVIATGEKVTSEVCVVPSEYDDCVSLAIRLCSFKEDTQKGFLLASIRLLDINKEDNPLLWNFFAANSILITY